MIMSHLDRLDNISEYISHREDTISFHLYLAGSTDGYNGTVPQSRDFDYLSGYAQGVERYSDYIHSLTIPEAIQSQKSEEELEPIPF